jgi:hypothetical protein
MAFPYSFLPHSFLSNSLRYFQTVAVMILRHGPDQPLILRDIDSRWSLDNGAFSYHYDASTSGIILVLLLLLLLLLTDYDYK